MNWKQVGNTVGKAAPWLGSLLGGKAGEAVGNVVASILGTDPTPEAVEAELAQNQEALLRLKEAQMTHRERLEELAIEAEKLDVQRDQNRLADVQNARGRDIQMRQAGYRNTRADVMLAMAFASFVFIAYLINSNSEIKPEVLAIFNMATGALLKMISDAFQFEFGSSRGSKEKDLKAKP